MTAAIWRLLRVNFAAAALMLVVATGSAYAQDHAAQRRVPSPLFIPAIVLIGSGAYLAYRRSRPTN